MISIEERLDFDLDPERLFSFLADFRNLPRWDPGIVHASLRSGVVTESSARYDIVSRFLGRRIPLVYQTRVYDAGEHFAKIAGEGDGVFAVDRIRVRPSGTGARLTWQADFELKGPLKWVDAMTKPVFVRLAKVAMRGLRAYVEDDGLG